MEKMVILLLKGLAWLALVFTYLWSTGLFLIGLRTVKPNEAWFLSVSGVVLVLLILSITGYECRSQLLNPVEDRPLALRRGLLALGGLVLTSLVVVLLMNTLKLGQTTDNQNILNGWLKMAGWRHVAMMVQVIIIAPISEELLFRGLFCRWFCKNSTSYQALLSAVAFATVHEVRLSLSWLLYFGTGLILVVLYQRQRDLKVNIVVHGLYNLISLV